MAPTPSCPAKRVTSSGTDSITIPRNITSPRCITTLLSNHYHTMGYLRNGDDLGPMMQHLHGSVAKLVNDLLPTRHVPFWRHRNNQDYFDGCIRDVLQATR